MALSWSTHGAAIDLERHVCLGQNGEIEAFKNEPEIEDQHSTWFCTAEIQLKSLIAIDKIFPSGRTEEITKYETALHELVAQYGT